MKKTLATILTATLLLPMLSVPSMAWKVVREEGDKASPVKMVQIVDDRLIVITTTGVYDIKLGQLEKLPPEDKPNQPPTPPPAVPPPSAPVAPPPAPTPEAAAGKTMPANAKLADQVQAELKKNGTWYVFTGKAHGFKVMNLKIVKTFQDGDLFKAVTVNGRMYLQDPSGVIYEPTWEISYDFTRFVMPLESYQRKQVNYIEKLRATLADREKELIDNKQMTVFYIAEIVKLLKGHDYTTAQFYNDKGDVNLNIIKNDDINPNSMLFYNDLRSKLNKLVTTKRRLERDIFNLKKELQSACERIDRFRERITPLLVK